MDCGPDQVPIGRQASCRDPCRAQATDDSRFLQRLGRCGVHRWIQPEPAQELSAESQLRCAPAVPSGDSAGPKSRLCVLARFSGWRLSHSREYRLTEHRTARLAAKRKPSWAPDPKEGNTRGLPRPNHRRGVRSQNQGFDGAVRISGNFPSSIGTRALALTKRGPHR